MATLKERAEQIRDEVAPGANTAARVGGVLVDLEASKLDFNTLTEEMPKSDSDMLFNIGGALRKKALAEVNGQYNLKWFGATGDGVTDDTNAIKTAMAEVPDGARLFAPQGTYIITDTIKRSGSITLIGVGSRGDSGPFDTKFKLPSGVRVNMFEFGDRVNNTAHGFHLEGFTARGTETSGDSYDLIQLHNWVRHTHIRDVFARACTGNAFYIQNDAGFTGAQNTYFYDCAAENTFRGYYIGSAYNTRIQNCYAGFGVMARLIEGQASNHFWVDNFWALENAAYISMNFSNGTIKHLNVTNSVFTQALDSAGSSFIQMSRPSGTGGGGSALIQGNTFGNTDAASESPNYGVRVNAPAYNVLIANNIFRSYTVRPVGIFSTSGNITVRDNNNQKVGRNDTNSGTGTIADGSSSVVIDHETYVKLAAHLGVNVTPTSGESIWVDNVTTDQFTVNRTGTAGALNFFWSTIGKWGS